MAKGWIKLHREILDNALWKETPFSKGQAWVDILLMVNHESKKILFDGQLMEIKAGQTVTSILKLSERWGWSRGKVKRFLNVLKTDTMVNVERTGNGHLITVVKWDDFQNVRTTDDTTNGQPMIQRTDNGRTQTRMNKNDKEGKNIAQAPDVADLIRQAIAEMEAENGQ